MAHEPIYLTEEQIAEIELLEKAILNLENDNTILDVARWAGIAAIENDIVAIQESAPAGKPKKKCPTCNTHPHCPTCDNPIDEYGQTTVEGGAYITEPSEEPADV